jgi:chaperone required for assembly of F1-ATPase
MRDIFEEIFATEPPDPVGAVRRGAPSRLRKRFYEKAEIGESAGGFAILLDGKPVKTPARRALAAPLRALSTAMAAEWNAQGEIIDPARMPLTRLANSIIDGVADKPAAVADDIVKYLASDLVFYRAGGPAELIERELLHWDPVLAWAREKLGARFVLAEGVVFIAQPQSALAAARAALPENPWELGALHAITTLTGSALLALALAHGALSAGDAWAAAHVGEDWNMDFWGRDDVALQRRALRFAELTAAATVLELLRDNIFPSPQGGEGAERA